MDPKVDPETLAREPDLLSTSEAGPSVVRGGALRVGSFFGSSLLAAGSAALLFRHLGVVQTGSYTTALSLSAVVTGFTDLGLTAIGVREMALLEGEQRALVARDLLGIRLALTVIGVVLITIFALIAYSGYLALGVLIAGGGVLVQNTQTTLSVPLIARLRLGWVAALDLIRQLVTSALIVALVLLGAYLLPFLATPLVAALAVLIPTIVLVRGDIPIRPSFRFRRWRALLAPVFTYSAAVAASTLYFRVAIVLVSLIAGAQELGYYSVAFRVVEVLFVIPALLVSSAFPVFARAARDDPARLGYALSRVFETCLIVGVWTALSLAVGAKIAVQILGGNDFLAAVPLLQIQGIAVGATFVSAVFGYGLLSLHLHRAILLLNLGMLVLVSVVVAVLVVLDGAEGAAIGMAGVEVVAAIANGVVLVRGRPHLKPRLSVLPKVAVAGLLGCLPFLASGLPVFARLVLSSLIYASVVLVLRAIPEELNIVLPPLLRRRS